MRHFQIQFGGAPLKRRNPIVAAITGVLALGAGLVIAAFSAVALLIAFCVFSGFALIAWLVFRHKIRQLAANRPASSAQEREWPDVFSTHESEAPNATKPPRATRKGHVIDGEARRID